MVNSAIRTVNRLLRLFKPGVAAPLRVGIGRTERQDPRPPWEISAELQNLLRLVEPSTMSDELRLALLYGLAREACSEGITGDIVECGVCNGGSAAVLAEAVLSDPARRIWLYDSFEGIPEPGPQDGELAKDFAGCFVGYFGSTQALLNRVHFPLDRAVFRPGFFRDTFRQPLPAEVALLHVDADWYESVLSALQTFYPAVVNGGLVVIDDFGHWEGARKAFYAFCRDQGIEPVLERVGYTQAFWRKGQEHNRDVQDRYRFGTYSPKYR